MPFIFGWIGLRCGFNMTLGKWTMLLRSVLVTLCIAAQIKVYVITRKYLRQAEVKPVSLPMRQLALENNGSTDAPAAESSVHDLSNSEEHQKTHHSSSLMSATKNAPYFVHRRNKTVSKLELEASLTLVVGVLSLCITTGNTRK